MPRVKQTARKTTDGKAPLDVPKTTATTQMVDSCLNGSRNGMFVYANQSYLNINHERNTIAAWPLCTIVISDNNIDDEKAQTDVSNKNLNCTMNSMSSHLAVINLDSSDEDKYTDTDVKYHMVVGPDGEIRKIADYHLAFAYPSNPKEQLPYGLRVIARRKQKHFPIAYSHHGATYLYHNDDSAFYAGILSCETISVSHENFRYLVFFDDGHVQYVSSNDVRVVFGNNGKRYVHENARKFYDYYFYRVKIKRMMEVTCVPEQILSVFLNHRFELAKVVEYDKVRRPGLMLLQFPNSHQAEWLYTGSNRAFENPIENLIAVRSNDEAELMAFDE